MRLSKTFSKTQKNAPADEVSLNAQLLIRAGYIHKELAGVYAYLPLGLRVVEKIKQIVREEMNAVGSEELVMTNLQSPHLWKETDRWSDENVDIWFKTALQDGKELGLAWSHEEPITAMLRSYINSYRDLPVSVYQFQTKLRNELRAKSGIMRGREFVMKDLYTYATDEDQHNQLYDEVKDAYVRVYERLGISEQTYITYASGGAFTDGYSHEFQTVCQAGEDVIYIDDESGMAVNEEMIEHGILKKLGKTQAELRKETAAEVGNIFSFGTTKTDSMGLHYTDSNGEQRSIYLGSYGIGITRVMGVLVELFSDDKGIVWPAVVAPARVHIVAIGAAGAKQGTALYEELIQRGTEVIFDDRDLSPGQKLADAELMGVPVRVVTSDRTAENGEYECSDRASGDTTMRTHQELLKTL